MKLSLLTSNCSLSLFVKTIVSVCQSNLADDSTTGESYDKCDAKGLGVMESFTEFLAHLYTCTGRSVAVSLGIGSVSVGSGSGGVGISKM